MLYNANKSYHSYYGEDIFFHQLILSTVIFLTLLIAFSTTYRNLYKSCMDEDHIEANGMREAAEILQSLDSGGWPVVLGGRWRCPASSGQLANYYCSWYQLIERANILGFGTSRILATGI
jgi:hypothetical protein